jgi:hypothetical protein
MKGRSPDELPYAAELLQPDGLITKGVLERLAIEHRADIAKGPAMTHRLQHLAKERLKIETLMHKSTKLRCEQVSRLICIEATLGNPCKIVHACG